MVGGNRSSIERITPFLKLMGSNITHVGKVGSGQAAKMANQVIVSITRAAFGEAVAFAKNQGVTAETLLKALTGGMADSPHFQSYLPRLYELGNPIEFSSVVLKKDINNVADIADRSGIELPLVQLTAQRYREYE